MPILAQLQGDLIKALRDAPQDGQKAFKAHADPHVDGDLDCDETVDLIAENLAGLISVVD